MLALRGRVSTIRARGLAVGLAHLAASGEAVDRAVRLGANEVCSAGGVGARDLGGLVRRMADATPPERDRTIDFLRAASILAVVCGHWLVATIQRIPHGIEVGNVLSEVSGLRPVTWVFQVMGVFFVVGGFSTRRAIEGRSRFDSGAFFAARAERLLRPTVMFIVAWLGAAAALTAFGVDAALVHDIARIAAQPLWFLAVYLVVTLIAPVQLRIHRSAPLALVVVLPMAVVGLDALRFSDVAPGLAVLNYLFVFAFAQELGFHFAGRANPIPVTRVLTVAAVAVAALGLLTTIGPYPVSMVGLPGAHVSNMSPPTVCILVLTLAQTAVLFALRPTLARWLERRGPWSCTVAMNAGIMTIFLWHLTAAAAMGGFFYSVNWLPAPASAAWWWAKIPWFIGCLVILVPLVLVTVGVERLPSWTRGQRGAVARRTLGVLIAVRGLAGFAVTGFDHLLEPGGRAFLGLELSPLVDLILVAGGYLLTCGIPQPGAGRRSNTM